MNEHPKNQDEVKSPEQHPGLSFVQQMEYANAMITAAQKRNEFAQNMGGGSFEGFAIKGQYSDDNRSEYDRLGVEFEKAREAFDNQVPDKIAFIKQLKRVNEKDLAKQIETMFRSQTGFTSRVKKIFKRE